MPTCSEYLQQIAKLRELAEQARQDELVEARKQIRELMQKYNLQLADLMPKQESKSSGSQRRSARAKYRDPESGKTWSGRGRTPRWLDGRNSDEFLIP